MAAHVKDEASDDLSKETVRQARRQRSRVPELLAAAIFLLGMLVTLGLWKNAQDDARVVLRTEFNFQANQIARRIEERMATYEQVQRGVQAFLLGSLSVSGEDFRLYVESLRLQQTYPGIQGIAISEVVHPAMKSAHEEEIRADGFPNYKIFPAGERRIYSAISRIEPFAGLNLRAHGFDMLTDRVRREAMERARDTGQAAASGKVKLIQENGVDEQPGLVMYLPVYRRGAPTRTVEERRQNILAWIGAPFRMRDFMSGLSGERSEDILLAIYDGNEVSESALLYRTSAEPERDAEQTASLFEERKRITVGGHPWTLEMKSSRPFEERLESDVPTLIALGGVTTSGILSVLIWALASGRRRALSLANVMTQHLRESEFHWKYALEGAGDGVWDLNAETGEIKYSKRWKEMLGYADADIANALSEWEHLIHPDDKEKALKNSREFLEGHASSYSNEFRMRCKDGSWKWILARGAVVRRNEEGKVSRAIGTHTDITERRLYEDALEHANNRLLAEQQRIGVILENSHDAFVALDSDGRITDWNAKAERIFGWSAREAIGAVLKDLILPGSTQEFHHGVKLPFIPIASAGRENRGSHVVEVDAIDKDGNVVPVELAIAGVPQGAGYWTSLFIRDIRERREAERVEAERARALEEARTASQHAQKLEAVGKLTGGVAHDFNNVLQTISGNVELLKYALAHQPPLENRLQNISAAVDRGAKLSSQLLSFARRQPLQPVALNPRRVIQEMADLLHRALGESIELETSATDDLWNVFADRGQLENVILNFAINARDAMPTGGRFSICMANCMPDVSDVAAPALAPKGEYVRISFADSGVGMSPEVAQQAFEPFFTTKPVGEGTGLGLSMAYGFVNQSEGQIELESAVGQGTTITIYLPRTLEAEEIAGTSEPGVPLGGDETVLVVEDDAEVRAAVVAMMRRLGYRVIEAHDGQSGLDVLNNQRDIDLLFTDVVMPGPVSSTRLAKEASKLIPGIPILFTSGYTRSALVTGGRLAKGVQLLGKPYTEEQLANKLRQILASTSTST